MSRSNLNNTIDSLIGNKTTEGSLSPLDEANALKAVADYAESISIVKTQKTTISQSQILDMYTNPIPILDSTTPGIAKIPLSIFIKRNGSGTNYTIATNQFSFLSSSGSTFSIPLSNNILTSSFPVSFTNFSANANSQIASGADNEIYKLGTYSSNPTGGTGAIDVYVTYFEINIS